MSPNLGSQLKVLNALIAGNPSQAAQLRQIRQDFLNAAFTGFDQSLTDQEEQLRRARLNRADLGDAPDDEAFQNTRAKVQFSKLFHNGIQVAPFVDFTSEGSNFRGKERKAEFGGKGMNDLYTTRVGSDFLLPLMRGRGSDALAAGERASTVEAQAGTLDVEHQRASSILRTAQAYWELRAAQESLAILERSVTRQGDLLRATTTLVNGGELARVELARSQAGEARARARALDARQRLYDARVELADALGVASSGADATLPTAAKDPFPVAPDAAALQPWVGATAAPGQRRDVEAAMRREEAAVILQRGAETDLRSRLDLSASLFYTALGEVGDVATEDQDENGRPIYRRDGFAEALRSLGRPELHADAGLREAARQQLGEGPAGRARGRAPDPRHRNRRPPPPGPPQRRPHGVGAHRDDRTPEADAVGVAGRRPDDHRGAVPLPRRRGNADQHDHDRAAGDRDRPLAHRRAAGGRQPPGAAPLRERHARHQLHRQRADAGVAAHGRREQPMTPTPIAVAARDERPAAFDGRLARLGATRGFHPWLLALSLALVPAVAGAQATPRPPAPPTTTRPQPAPAPVQTAPATPIAPVTGVIATDAIAARPFGAAKAPGPQITLAQAIDLVLKYQPRVSLAAQDTLTARAQLREATGLFDRRSPSRPGPTTPSSRWRRASCASS